MDEIERAQHDEFEIEHPELSLATSDALAKAPRLSPAARRFMVGDMPADEAEKLGFTRGDGEVG